VLKAVGMRLFHDPAERAPALHASNPASRSGPHTNVAGNAFRHFSWTSDQPDNLCSDPTCTRLRAVGVVFVVALTSNEFEATQGVNIQCIRCVLKRHPLVDEESRIGNVAAVRSASVGIWQTGRRTDRPPTRRPMRTDRQSRAISPASHPTSDVSLISCGMPTQQSC
jgi:hypothetical protein